MKSNMPVVPVTDLLVHPRESDLVVATFGRGLFLTHIAPLRELNDTVLAAPLHVFTVRARGIRDDRAWGNYELSGDRHAFTPNEPNGLVFEYHVAQPGSGRARVAVARLDGTQVTSFEDRWNAGFNRAVWDGTDTEGRRSAPGEYNVTIEVGDAKMSRRAVLLR
jgi:hypothetical protein